MSSILNWSCCEEVCCVLNILIFYTRFNFLEVFVIPLGIYGERFHLGVSGIKGIFSLVKSKIRDNVFAPYICFRSFAYIGRWYILFNSKFLGNSTRYNRRHVDCNALLPIKLLY